MGRRIWKKYDREIANLNKEMKLEQKLFHRSLTWEEANMHQERYTLLRIRRDEIVRKAEFEVEAAYDLVIA